MAQLSDEDLRLDFSREAGELDEVAVIVTSPQTNKET